MGDRLGRRGLRWLAPVLLVALVAAACGGGGDSGGGNEESTAPGESSFEFTELEPDTAEPQYGGDLIYGIEADTDNGWITTNFVCAISCGQVIRSVYDPLVEIDEDGNVVPFLLESVTPNEDFTEWTLVTREGITFHDGTPFNADAVVQNLNAHQTSLVTSRAVQDANPAVAVDDRTVVVTTKVPWVRFDLGLATQVGYMASPTWLDAVEAGTANPDEPVGTGPFVFDSYTPGGDFKATRNEDYWLSDADGNQLPFLDSITYRIFNDAAARERALTTGEIDIMHVAQGNVVANLRENEDIELVETSQGAEVTYLMLNAAAPDTPLADVEVRRALAQAINREEFTQARSEGVQPVANGPFSPDAEGWLEDTGFPEYDLEAAEQTIADWEAENGDMVLSIKTTNDQSNRQTVELAAALWEAVGVTVEIDQVEQGSFVIDAANGDFEVITFRNLGGIDADQRNYFWNSATSAPVGTLAINFNRIEDDVIDENLGIVRSNPDEDARREAAEAINRRFGEQVYNIWLSWQVWGIAYQPDVHQVATGAVSPDNVALQGLRSGGSHQVSQIWMDQS